eukprot:5657627-Amphidinium_carterae.1
MNSCPCTSTWHAWKAAYSVVNLSGRRWNRKFVVDVASDRTVDEPGYLFLHSQYILPLSMPPPPPLLLLLLLLEATRN